VIFTALDLFRNFLISGSLAITPLYAWAGVIAFLIWIILRIIHKTTSWFTVEGR